MLYSLPSPWCEANAFCEIFMQADVAMQCRRTNLCPELISAMHACGACMQLHAVGCWVVLCRKLSMWGGCSL